MKLRYRLIYVTIFALFVEIVLFNFSYLMGTLDKNIEKNVIYTLKDIEKINWIQNENWFISKEDPMLIISDINTYVKDFELSLSIDKKLPFIMCYYTQDKEDIFNDSMSIALVDNLSDKNHIKVNSYVRGLRLDLGDDAGVNLNNLSIIINPVKLNFSIARVITIVLIYITSKGLFYIQKSHSYGDLIQDERGNEIE